MITVREIPLTTTYPNVAITSGKAGFGQSAVLNSRSVDAPEDAHSPVVSPRRQNSFRRIFVGDDGLRAGWSLLVFFLLLAVLILVVQPVINHFHPLGSAVPVPTEMTAQETVLTNAWQLAALALVTLLMSRIERRPFACYGLARSRMLIDFGFGLLWGLVFISLLVGSLVLFHFLRVDGVQLQTVPALLYAGKWLVAFLLVGLLEEFWFRGYLQFTLARGISGIAQACRLGRYAQAIGFWVSAIILSGFFVLSHANNKGESALGMLSAGMAGIVLAFSLYRTGSLWWAIGFHTTWDWAQSYLYGVQNSGTSARGHLFSSYAIGSPLISGGAAGPEGSILVIPTLLLAALVIRLTLAGPGLNDNRRARLGCSVDLA